MRKTVVPNDSSHQHHVLYSGDVVLSSESDLLRLEVEELRWDVSRDDVVEGGKGGGVLCAWQCRINNGKL